MTNSKTTKLTALLLAGVLATSCFVGGTLARYVTSTSSEDSARVAVWGINADEVTMDLFDATYTVNGVTVAQSEDGDNIIAPGTQKDNYFSIVNLDENLKPEVMYQISINLDDSEIDPLILNNPSIVWRLDDGTYGTWEETKAQVLALSGDASGVKTYAPLEIAENFKADKTHKIGWKWIMDNNNNVMDTEMGNKAVDGDISAKINIKVTAVQVNEDTPFNTSSPIILNGNGQVYNQFAPVSPLSFRSSAPVDQLQEVQINGVTVDENHYTVTEGSTIITFDDEYANELALGEASIAIVSETGSANGTFSVVNEVPSGGKYTSGSNVYEDGLTVPGIAELGDTFTYGDYRYEYNPYVYNWSVSVIDTTKEVYEPILPVINGKPVQNLSMTFQGCTNMKVAPQIPDQVENLFATFTNCTSLQVAPKIPSTAFNLVATFEGCTSLTSTPSITVTRATSIDRLFYGCKNLTGDVELNLGNPSVSYVSAFENTEKSITLKGTSASSEIAATANNNNVTLDN